ncbi:MAG: beta-N-acetylhexosaminidase [Rhodobacteraceae bacterium]|nr:beta-N-acetylhexosaminidase [Paracoccaceae bacterium]
MSLAELAACKALIVGCAGLKLSDEEADFFAEQQPYGFILFARNVDTPEQVRTLVTDLRRAVGRMDAPVLIDQEGGRVQRLRGPHWFEASPFGFFGALYGSDPDRAEAALVLTARLIAADLSDLGITVNCTPCLDLSLPETASAIGDRAFAADPAIVARLGAIVADEMAAAGIMPVIKHMPGHGRGSVDSHHELPTVSASLDQLRMTDFMPFMALSHLPWGMTSHIVFDQIDRDHPATQSAIIIDEVIRGAIGFEGLLLTDDLNMNALSGGLPERAERALEAGVDIVLHCSGKLPEMRDIAPMCPMLSTAALARIAVSDDIFSRKTLKYDTAEDQARLSVLLADFKD